MVAFPLWRWDMATNEAVSRPVHHVQTDTHTIIFQQDAYVYETTWPYVEEVDAEAVVAGQFGEGIGLVGFDLVEADGLELVLYWESLTAVNESYDVFVHLVDAAGEIAAQADGKPVNGLAPTDLWQAGDKVRDVRSISLPAGFEGGSYEVRLGLYERESGARLPVTRGVAIEEALIVGPVVVRP
jgi:hypothetical protein